jgi:hypothetical protein
MENIYEFGCAFQEVLHIGYEACKARLLSAFLTPGSISKDAQCLPAYSLAPMDQLL